MRKHGKYAKKTSEIWKNKEILQKKFQYMRKYVKYAKKSSKVWKVCKKNL